MNVAIIAVAIIVALILPATALKIIKQYERGVLFRFGRVMGIREPGLRAIIPFVDVLRRVTLRIAPRIANGAAEFDRTMPTPGLGPMTPAKVRSTPVMDAVGIIAEAAVGVGTVEVGVRPELAR